MRISAKKLLRHPWMLSAKKQMAAQQTSTATADNAKAGEVSATNNYNFDQAVQRVQQWNEALKSPTKSVAPKQTRVRSPSPTPVRGDIGTVMTWKLSSPPSRSRSSSAGMASGLPFIPNLIPLGNTAPTVARPMVVPEVEEATDNWDDDFEEDITLTKLQFLDKAAPAAKRSTEKPKLAATVAVPAPVSQRGIPSNSTPTKKRSKALADNMLGSKSTPDGEDKNSRTIKPTPTQSPTVSNRPLPSTFKTNLQDPIPNVPPLPSSSVIPASPVEDTPKPATSTALQKPRLPTLSMGSQEESYDDLLEDGEDLFGKVESFKVRAF